MYLLLLHMHFLPHHSILSCYIFTNYFVSNKFFFIYMYVYIYIFIKREKVRILIFHPD